MGKVQQETPYWEQNNSHVKKSLNSVTKYCSLGSSVVKDRHVSVIDTPGFFDTTLPENMMAEEMAKSVFLSAPGSHAFLFVLPVDRFTKQEVDVLAQIQMIFGEDVLKYLIILFTNGDDIDLETFKTEVNEHNILRPIVERCQGRFHVFNNKEENNREQVNDLLLMIDTMIEQNGGGHCSNQMYVEAQRYRQEKEERRSRGNSEEADDREEQSNESERLIPDIEKSYSDSARMSAFLCFFQWHINIFRFYASKMCGCCRSVSDSD